MDRKEARRRAEVMIAFANGSDVQFYNEVTKQWEDIRPECVLFEPAAEYRVKPEPKYRPFKNQEECWEEMHKHPDFGWVKDKEKLSYYPIQEVSDTNHYRNLLNDYEFTDGAPFGVKEE